MIRGGTYNTGNDRRKLHIVDYNNLFSTTMMMIKSGRKRGR
jgi:hypothetical protein